MNEIKRKPGRPKGSGGKPLSERFWAMVDKTPTCWNYTGAKTEFGYGYIGRGGKHGGATVTHRVSWVLHHGEIPSGIQVLHKCDNPKCVRPDHLFLGTQKDNMQDASKKGRCRNGREKLTEPMAKALRDRYTAGGISMKKLGREFNVSAMSVWRAVHEWS